MPDSEKIPSKVQHLIKGRSGNGVDTLLLQHLIARKNLINYFWSQTPYFHEGLKKKTLTESHQQDLSKAV